MRLQPDLKAALTVAAHMTGRSVSAVAEAWMREGALADADQQRRIREMAELTVEAGLARLVEPASEVEWGEPAGTEAW